MRSLVSHKCVGLNQSLCVNAGDSVSPGGACCDYEIHYGENGVVKIPFQNGEPNLVGVNGISMECLLAIVADRLEGLQANSWPCRENALALTKIQEAMHWLHHREISRIMRGE